jgi:carboxypeptidase C (cathepsin A)
VKNFENFTFMRVRDAGHMVPMDQPEAAYDMIMEFVKTKKITGK